MKFLDDCYGVFGGSVPNCDVSTSQTVYSTFESLCNRLRAKELKHGSTIFPATRSCLLWHKSPINYIKCNTDATTFNDTSHAGLAIAFHDSDGRLLAARSSRIDGVPMVKECEALTLLEAIVMALDYGFHRVLFKTKAKHVVDAIQSIETDHSEFGIVISTYRSLLHEKDSYSVSYVRQQANGITHALASESCFFYLSHVLFRYAEFFTSCN